MTFSLCFCTHYLFWQYLRECAVCNHQLLSRRLPLTHSSLVCLLHSRMVSRDFYLQPPGDRDFRSMRTAKFSLQTIPQIPWRRLDSLVYSIEAPTTQKTKTKTESFFYVQRTDFLGVHERRPTIEFCFISDPSFSTPFIPLRGCMYAKMPSTQASRPGIHSLPQEVMMEIYNLCLVHEWEFFLPTSASPRDFGTVAWITHNSGRSDVRN